MKTLRAGARDADRWAAAAADTAAALLRDAGRLEEAAATGGDGGGGNGGSGEVRAGADSGPVWPELERADVWAGAGVRLPILAKIAALAAKSARQSRTLRRQAKTAARLEAEIAAMMDVLEGGGRNPRAKRAAEAALARAMAAARRADAKYPVPGRTE